MSTHEIVISLEFFKQVLVDNTDLAAVLPGGMWPDSVPTNQPAPFGIYGYQTGSDTNTANGVRLLTQPLYQVRVSGPESMIDQVATASAIVDDILKVQRNVSVPGGFIAACYRESPLHLPNNIDGTKWVSIGGLYRTVLQQAPT
jgi:hypothetical protein